MSKRVVNSMGLADVLNPTAGTQLDCGLFAGGVFKPECWCLSFPALCPTSTYQAAQGIANPTLVYAPVNPLVPPAAIPAGSVAALPSVDQAVSQTDAVLSGAVSQDQADFASSVDQTAANLAATAASQPGFNLSSVPSWIWWAAGGGLLFLLFTFNTAPYARGTR